MFHVLPQQQLLRKAMKSLGLTRKQFANQIGVKTRRLDSWLLPSESSEFRQIDSAARLVVEKMLRREALIADSRLVVIDDRGDDQDRITCPHGVVFPPVYRLTGYSQRAGTNGKTNRKSKLERPSYILNPHEKHELSIACAKRVTKLDPSIDSGWVIVRRHGDVENLHGYTMALMDLIDQIESNDIHHKMVYTPKGLFTLIHRPAHPGVEDCLIIYATDCLVDPDSIDTDECLTIVRSNGESITTDSIWGLDKLRL